MALTECSASAPTLAVVASLPPPTHEVPSVAGVPGVPPPTLEVPTVAGVPGVPPPTLEVPPVAGIPREHDGDLPIVVHDLPNGRLGVKPQVVDGLANDLGNGSDCCEGEQPRSATNPHTQLKLSLTGS